MVVAVGAQGVPVTGAQGVLGAAGLGRVALGPGPLPVIVPLPVPVLLGLAAALPHVLPAGGAVPPGAVMAPVHLPRAAHSLLNRRPLQAAVPTFALLAPVPAALPRAPFRLASCGPGRLCRGRGRPLRVAAPVPTEVH